MNKIEIPGNVNRWKKAATGLLTDPLMAFKAATTLSDVPSPVRQLFAGALNARCAHRRWVEMATLSGNPEEAFDAFADRVRMLLDSWRPWAPDAIAWCEANPTLYEEIITAQLQRRTAIMLPDILTRHAQEAAGGKPKLIMLSKFYRQTSYAEAGKAAATALFGDFLAGEPTAIRFCARKTCGIPFRPTRTDQQFHPGGDCGKAVSSNRAHENDQRRERLGKLRDYAGRLNDWIRNPRGDWRDAVERDSRKRKLLSLCLRAVQQNGTEARSALIERCFDTRLPSSAEVERDIDSLLASIRRAIELQDRKAAK